MKTQIDLLTETENILLTLLAQYKSGQYALLAKSIDNIRALKAGWECDWCGLPNLESDLICRYCNGPVQASPNPLRGIVWE